MTATRPGYRRGFDLTVLEHEVLDAVRPGRSTAPQLRDYLGCTSADLQGAITALRRMGYLSATRLTREQAEMVRQYPHPPPRLYYTITRSGFDRVDSEL